MAERPCPKCRADNPSDNRYCGQCGSPLRFHELIEGTTSAVKPLAGLLPDADRRQMTRTLALSLGALVAEAALLQLRRRVRGQLDREEQTTSNKSLRKTGVGLLTGVVVMIAERQLIEMKDGRPVRQLIERRVWRKDETV